MGTDWNAVGTDWNAVGTPWNAMGTAGTPWEQSVIEWNGLGTEWERRGNSLENSAEGHNILHAQFSEKEIYANVHVHVINPLALSNEGMYGTFDKSTNEWRDGILPKITTKCVLG